jgi:hypothetical protein
VTRAEDVLEVFGLERALDVGDFPVDVADVDTRVGRHRQKAAGTRWAEYRPSAMRVLRLRPCSSAAVPEFRLSRLDFDTQIVERGMLYATRGVAKTPGDTGDAQGARGRTMLVLEHASSDGHEKIAVAIAHPWQLNRRSAAYLALAHPACLSEEDGIVWQLDAPRIRQGTQAAKGGCAGVLRPGAHLRT